MRDALGSGRTVLVLGGHSEIGLATATALVNRGARTVLLAAREPSPESEQRLRGAGADTVESVCFDALDTADHAAVIDRAFDDHGDIDVVVVAFGLLGEESGAQTDPAAALAVVETNYVGAVSVMLRVAHRLDQQGHGALVLFSSVAGERARRSNFVYGSSKAGIDAFAQGLRDSLLGRGVQVLVVRPGFVHTRMTAGMDPAPFATTPEAVAKVVVEGLSRGAHTVWAPPALRFVMSALRHLPRSVFSRLPI